MTVGLGCLYADGYIPVSWANIYSYGTDTGAITCYDETQRATGFAASINGNGNMMNLRMYCSYWNPPVVTTGETPVYGGSGGSTPTSFSDSGLSMTDIIVIVGITVPICIIAVICIGCGVYRKQKETRDQKGFELSAIAVSSPHASHPSEPPPPYAPFVEPPRDEPPPFVEALPTSHATPSSQGSSSVEIRNTSNRLIYIAYSTEYRYTILDRISNGSKYTVAWKSYAKLTKQTIDGYATAHIFFEGRSVFVSVGVMSKEHECPQLIIECREVRAGDYLNVRQQSLEVNLGLLKAL